MIGVDFLLLTNASMVLALIITITAGVLTVVVRYLVGVSKSSSVCRHLLTLDTILHPRGVVMQLQ